MSYEKGPDAAAAAHRASLNLKPSPASPAISRRRTQLDRLARQARAHGYAHEDLNRAVRAVFDCRRHLAAANDSRTREAFGRLVRATRQAGLWLDWEEGDE